MWNCKIRQFFPVYLHAYFWILGSTALAVAAVLERFLYFHNIDSVIYIV